MTQDKAIFYILDHRISIAKILLEQFKREDRSIKGTRRALAIAKTVYINFLHKNIGIVYKKDRRPFLIVPSKIYDILN